MNKYEELRVVLIDELSEIVSRNVSMYHKLDNALELLSNYSPIYKKYYFSLDEIFIKHFNINRDKFLKYNFISKYIYENQDLKYSKYAENFKVELFSKPCTYIKLIRGSGLSSGKGMSTLYPVLNFKNKNKYNCNIPIELNLSGEEFQVYDYYYFKVISNKGGGTHRTVGICTGLWLLKNCSIKLNYYEHYQIKNKSIINDVTQFFEKINNNKYIEKFDYTQVSYSGHNVVIHMSQMKLEILFNNIEDVYSFILDEKFDNFVDKLNFIQIKSLIIKNNYYRIYSYGNSEITLNIYNNKLNIFESISRISIANKAYFKLLQKSYFFSFINKYCAFCMHQYTHDKAYSISQLGRMLAYQAIMRKEKNKSLRKYCIGILFLKNTIPWVLIIVLFYILDKKST